MKIENLSLDDDNQEFNYAVEIVKSTNQNLFLTGKAGTGKTTFLKYIKTQTQKNTVILAPTGVAAINAGGVTIHSFFQVPFGPFVANDKRLRMNPEPDDKDKSTIYNHFNYFKDKKKIIQNLELLIIDEVSMVRCDMLDVIDKLLRAFTRKNPNLPFGGIQIILIGDTFQLPPIAKPDQWNILCHDYKSPFFFSSHIVRSLIMQNQLQYIELKKIYRQNEQDFIDLLNRVRINQTTTKDIELLNKKCNPELIIHDKGYITLATHNTTVNQINDTRLADLETPLICFEADVTGIFPENNMPTAQTLKLKKNAQIMFIKNDFGEKKKYYNGKIGEIKELANKKIIVQFDTGKTIELERLTWKNIRYIWNQEKHQIEEDVIGTFTQYPVKLAWAITVHKSQGLTFEKLAVDLEKAFAPGQVYVALSRCTTFNGLVLKTNIGRGAIKTDPIVLRFAEHETPNTLIIEALNEGKADFYYKKSRECIRKKKYNDAFDNFCNAIKYRNDIEKPEFKKFIINTLKRKDLPANILKKIKTLNKTEKPIKSTKQPDAKLDKKLQTQTKKIKRQDEKIKRQSAELKNLTLKIKEYKNITKQQEIKLKKLTNNSK